MAKQTFLLDPNAQSYTDNQIVAKVNAATDIISRVGFTDLDTVGDGTTNKHLTATEKTKLSGIEDNATADQAPTEIRDAIVGLSDADRKIVITEPTTGKFKVISLQRDSVGKLEVAYDDVQVP